MQHPDTVLIHTPRTTTRLSPVDSFRIQMATGNQVGFSVLHRVRPIVKGSDKCGGPETESWCLFWSHLCGCESVVQIRDGP